MAAAGAEVIAGSLEDVATIDRYIDGAYGVYSVHPGPLAPEQDEVKAGKAIADAAVKYGVTHLVYSSGLGADRGGQPTKWEIEQHIAAAGVSATVLRPSSFMENLITQSATVGIRGPDRRDLRIAVRCGGGFGLGHERGVGLRCSAQAALLWPYR